MNDTMSIPNERKVIWADADSTTHQKKNALPQTNDGCDITTVINDLNGNVPSTVTTRISGIYKIVNKINGKYYVGSSKDVINYRWIHHKRALRSNRHKNDYLQNAWNKYGEDNFEIIIHKTSTSKFSIGRRTKLFRHCQTGTTQML